jgi:hypothetical protein
MESCGYSVTKSCCTISSVCVCVWGGGGWRGVGVGGMGVTKGQKKDQ